MKIKNIIGIGLAAVLISGCAWEHCEKCEKGEKGEKSEAKTSEADLMAQAKVTKESAQAIAMAKVPNGTIKEGELEKENGHLQWSFDMATPDSKDITEVNVDAITGEIISAAKESASDEAKEASEDAAKEKKKKEKDDDKD
jgi:hypothetical protein